MIENAQSALDVPFSLAESAGPAEDGLQVFVLPEAVVTSPRSVPDWLVVMEAVRAEPRQVTQVWYPDARSPLFELPNGSNANVLTGDPAYQVSDGEIVAL